MLESQLQPQPGRFEPPLKSYYIEYPHKTISSHRRGLKYRIGQQKGGYDFNIYNLKKFWEKLKYIHNNPVRANLCESPCDYKWSSYRNYHEEKGVMEIDIPEWLGLFPGDL